MGRPRKHPRRWFRANETFAFVDPEDGQHYSFHIGDILPEGKLLEKCKMYFEPLDEDYPPGEGELRSASPKPAKVTGEVK